MQKEPMTLSVYIDKIFLEPFESFGSPDLFSKLSVLRLD